MVSILVKCAVYFCHCLRAALINLWAFPFIENWGINCVCVAGVVQVAHMKNQALPSIYSVVPIRSPLFLLTATCLQVSLLVCRHRYSKPVCLPWGTTSSLDLLCDHPSSVPTGLSHLTWVYSSRHPISRHHPSLMSSTTPGHVTLLTALLMPAFPLRDTFVLFW